MKLLREVHSPEQLELLKQGELRAKRDKLLWVLDNGIVFVSAIMGFGMTAGTLLASILKLLEVTF